MKFLLAAVAIVLSACTSTPLQNPYGHARATVRMLDIPGLGNGSGVVVSTGVLLTAGHVAEEIPNGLLAEPGTHPVTLMRKGEGVDIAVVAADVKCPCAKIAEYPAQQDEAVIVIGFPLGAQIHTQVLTHGSMQGMNGSEMEMTAPVAGGNSGGGVFVYRDGEWQLVGILIATHGQPVEGTMGTAGVAINYLSIAVGLADMKKVLDDGPRS